MIKTSNDSDSDQGVILIVDDNKPLAEVYRARLEIEGFKVVVKHDGEEALKWLAGSQSLSLIILDCMLPKFSGFGVLEALKKKGSEYAKVPVIMISSLDRPEYKEKAANLGALDYLVKDSASISDMVDVVNKYVRPFRF